MSVIKALKPKTRRLAARTALQGLGIALVLLTSTSCAQIASLTSWFSPKYDATLTVEVAPLNALGGYWLNGTTNLPEGTRLAIAALRYLEPGQQTAPSQNPTYSILDYQEVEVENGQWQGALNLWDVAPDGRYQETWQLQQQELGLNLAPDGDVMFVAMLAPSDLPALEGKLLAQRIQLASRELNLTADGDRFLQVSQQMAIALPSGRTTPPPIRPEEINGGWGKRYLILPEPPNTIQLEQPAERQTTAPIRPEEMVR